MSESVKDETVAPTLFEVLQNDFGVPEGNVEGLINAIPLMHEGMVLEAQNARNSFSIKDLVESDRLTEEEKKLFTGLDEDQRNELVSYMNDISKVLPVALYYGPAWDWSKYDAVKCPEDEATHAAVTFLLNDCFPREYKKTIQEFNDSQKTFMEDTLDMEFDEGSIKIDEETGILTGTAVMTSAMVQEYKEDNGKTRRILKCPDELRKIPISCRQIPITDEHPSDRMVNDPEQIKGWTGIPMFDEERKNLVAPVEIGGPHYDAGALIKKIQDGKTDNSIGFICELDETPGKFADADGKEHEYDAKQVKIILNHLAAGLDKGRGRCPDGVCGITKDACKDKKEETTDDDLVIQAAQPNPTGGKCKCPKCGGMFPPGDGLTCSETECPQCNGVHGVGPGEEKQTPGPDEAEQSFNDSNLENIDDEFADLIYGLYEFDEETTDARLTAAQRKELPDDVFCGPNRSFPVNDCVHYTAAKRLLGRYKGEGSKTTILECIEKRGKALKCPGAVEEESDEPEPVQPPETELAVEPPAETEINQEEPGETETETENTGVNLEMHKKLMQEKVNAMKSIAEKMASATDPDEIKKLSESLSALNSYEFRNEELITLGAKRDKTSEDEPTEDKPEDKTEDDSMDKKDTPAEQEPPEDEVKEDEDPITEEEIKDARDDINEAYRILLDNKTRMVDKIMDFHPLHDRDHYMTMQIDQLRELLSAYVSGEKRPTSTSDSSTIVKDVNDAYAKVQEKLDRR